MTLAPLPLTVVSGYLGAGKTTLINRLLQEPHGQRLMVLVNDFGAINIDAGLIAAADGDSIALTNGCVCCTMGADLFMALGDVLDRRPRPDHLVIEASGIADPARIANTALAEPELSYAGIVTVVDEGALPGLLDDPQIAPQIQQQIDCADLIVGRTAPERALGGSASVPLCAADDIDVLAPLILEMSPAGDAGVSAVLHPDYAGWHTTLGSVPDRAAIEQAIGARPNGLYRLKGTVCASDGTAWLVQAVGPRAVVSPIAECAQTRLVGLGLAARFSPQDADIWWSAAISPEVPPR